VWWAGYLLIPFVLSKSLNASEGLVALSISLDTSGMLLALYWGHLLSHGPRRRVTFWGGLLGRGGLVLALFVTSPGQFMILLAVVYFFGALSYPAQNGMLQANFRPELRGRIWGIGTSIGNLVAVATSLVVGRVLDHDPELYGQVYAVIGVVGFLYLWVLARLPGSDSVRTEAAASAPAMPAPAMPAPAMPAPAPGAAVTAPIPLSSADPVSGDGPTSGDDAPRGWARNIIRPFVDAVTVFRRDRGFLWFEINFMTYGMAFLMTYTMLPILLAREFSLSYEQISTARIVIAQSGVALLAPLMGRLSDRYHPAGVCLLAFGVMALFPLGLILVHVFGAGNPVHWVYLVFVIYAVGMAGVNIGWNVGSISFAPPGQGSQYQGIHVALVGIRGLIAPAIGYLLLRSAGIDVVFALASGIFLTAALSSAALWRWLRGGSR